ncbi:MAG: iron ABC transporter permease [Synergistaceae bacterium]|jgi:iron complex transport system permease protein|nr:iron ABC transporter permease [Synergistaceae bacterium]
MRRRRAFVFFAISVLVLFLCPWLGASPISPSDALNSSGLESKIFWQIRMPRVIFAWCAGATFGVCGMVFQAIFRNPLAEPSILGVSAGAALGAAAAIRFGFGTSFLGAALPVSAFAGSMLSIAIISALSRMVKGTKDATLLLAGVAISSLFSSLIMVFQYTGGAAETHSLISWTMGGISAVGMNDGLRALPSVIISLALAIFFSGELDLMMFGDEIATTRGVSIDRTRRLLFAGVSLSIAIVVANCGPIAFLGLIAPHAARSAAGYRHKNLSIMTAAIGGSALVLCDTAARTLLAPADIPVGIIVSFLGAPFFLWLLFKR